LEEIEPTVAFADKFCDSNFHPPAKIELLIEAEYTYLINSVQQEINFYDFDDV